MNRALLAISRQTRRRLLASAGGRLCDSPVSRSITAEHRAASFSSASFMRGIDNTHPLYELEGALPHISFSRNPYELLQHGQGESHHPMDHIPGLIAFPQSVEEVQELVRFCVPHRIAMIPYGAGTGLEGQVGAMQPNCLSIDLSNLQSIEIMPGGNEDDDDNDGVERLPDPLAVVGAGVRRHQLNESLRHTGFQFTVDPGADATLGGMAATGASGTTTVRYGTMKDNLLALQCVLGNEEATVVEAGTRALKNSAGYDLVSLFCGSEGTLGIITSVTVKLHPIPDHIVAVKCTFPTLHQAAQAVAILKLHELPLVRCELLDGASVKAFNTYCHSAGMDHTDLPVVPTLFLELQGTSEASLQEQVKLAHSLLEEDLGAQDISPPSYADADRQQLWKARHSLYYAAIASRPGATGALVTDSCVPLSHLADLISATAKDVEEEGVVGLCFGHAGDGNFHCILPVCSSQAAAKAGIEMTVTEDGPDYWAKLQRIQDNLVKRTLKVGGTCTGEHGVGSMKTKYLREQYGDGAFQTMQLIQKALDPYNLMNPGKVIVP